MSETDLKEVKKMGAGEFANAINGAINGTIGLGFGIYDRYKQNQQNKLNEEQWNIARQDSLHAFSNTVKDMQSVGISPLAMQGLNPIQGANGANGVVSGGMNDLFKGIGDDLNRKDKKAEADRTHEYNMAKLDAEKAKALAELEQAKNELAELKRHNLKEEDLRGQGMNAKNRFLNWLIDGFSEKLSNDANGYGNPKADYKKKGDGEAKLEDIAEAELLRMIGQEVPKDHIAYDPEKDNPFLNGDYKKTDKKYKKEYEKSEQGKKNKKYKKAQDEEDFKKNLRPDVWEN